MTLQAYEIAARDYVERYCNRQLVTATWELQLDAFPCGLGPINLPRAPLASVTSITYLAASDGSSTVWSNTEYRVLTSTEPGKIVPVFNYYYPASRYTDGAVVVRYIAGQAVASVPEGLKAIIKILVSNLFESRGAELLVTDGVKALLDSYRVADDFLRYEREPEYAAAYE